MEKINKKKKVKKREKKEDRKQMFLCFFVSFSEFFLFSFFLFGCFSFHRSNDCILPFPVWFHFSKKHTGLTLCSFFGLSLILFYSSSLCLCYSFLVFLLIKHTCFSSFVDSDFLFRVHNPPKPTNQK